MEVRKYLIASLIIFVVKVLFGFVLNSNALLASSILEVMFIVFNILGKGKKDNKKYKGIISSLISMLFIILSIGVIYYSFIGGLNKPSWLIIPILIILLFIRYIVLCLGIVGTYNKKSGLLLFGNMTSNMDFILMGIILGSLILCKLSKFISIFKYADVVGTILISLIVMYYGVKVIVNSIKYMEDKVSEKVLDVNEILSQKQVKKVNKVSNYAFGGIRRININLELNNGINLNDLSGFVLSLQDYALKFGEMVSVNLVEQVKVTNKSNKLNKPHVRSKKEDARNSGSRNGKTNSKKKNTKKTNKKR